MTKATEAASSTYEGRQEYVRTMEMPSIETWENKYTDREYSIHMEIPEFTCICPKTGLPDFATLTIDYAPAELCVELKSFKEYIFAYRNIGIFHEHVVNRVLDDFVSSCHPRSAKVRGVFNARGGIQTTVEANFRTPS